MRRIASGCLIVVIGLVAAPRKSGAQESCTSPIVIEPGTSGAALVDLTVADDDHGGCGVARAGGDIVFYANASNAELSFTIVSQGPITQTVYVDFTFWCNPDSACAASFILPAQPGIPITLSGPIARPVYLVVNGPYPALASLPVQFSYSLGYEVQVAGTTWGRLKGLYR